MSFIVRGMNTGFTCVHCGQAVPPLQNGSLRNHCPFCLYGLHLDESPGDRAADCAGLLEPVGVEHSGKKGWVIRFCCQRCGIVRRNKAALDDPVPDDYELIIRLAEKGTGI